MWPEIKRKLFHLTALLYVVGIIYLPRTVFVGIIALALTLALAVEFTRLKRPAVGAWFVRTFDGLLRAKEAEQMSGVPWMLAGIGVVAVMVSPLPLAVASMLYLILGDAVASLVGMRFGGTRWPGSNKSIVGSVACYAVCLVVGAAVLRPEYAWFGIVVGALVATLCERGVIPLDDNFTIPVGAGLALCLVYRVLPFSGLWE